MRKSPFLLLAFAPMFVSCAKEKRLASLPEIFIESLVQHKIELLEPYFPTIEFHKSLERNGGSQPDSAALKFIEESNTKLKEGWTRISERIKSSDIDLSKVKIIESISAQQYWNKNILRMVVVYNYENKNWDDMEFLVGVFNDKNLLLEIPVPDRVFSMKDSSLNSSKSARFEIDIRTPEFKKMLQGKVDTIISFAKENKVKELGEYIFYPDDDIANREQITAGFMEKINNIMVDCGNPEYGDVNSLDLNDGKWIIIQLKCSNQFVHFAFNRVNGKLLLNDVNAAGLK